MSNVDAAANHWPTRRLGDLLVRHNEIIHPADRKSGEATFVGLEHIEANTGRRTGSLTIDLAKLTGRKPTFRRGQIVYGYLRPYLNKVWIAEFDGCSSVDQFAFDVRQDIADTRFVAAFMRSETFLRRSEVVTTTGQLPRISVDEIAAVPIELPPLADQRRISEELKESLVAVEAAHRAAHDRLAAANSLQAAYLREVFEGRVAREWQTSRLGDVTTKIGSGITPRGGQSNYVDTGVPLIRSQNVHLLRFAPEGLAFITAEQDSAMKLSRVEPGDILLNITGASIGRVCVVPAERCPANVNQHVAILRSKPDRLLPEFLAGFLASPQFQDSILFSQAGATRQALTKQMIEEFEVPTPDIKEQQPIVDTLSERLDRAGPLIARCREELTEIEALPATLLRATFNGDL